MSLQTLIFPHTAKPLEPGKYLPMKTPYLCS
jgi:hypothetical protein